MKIPALFFFVDLLNQITKDVNSGRICIFQAEAEEKFRRCVEAYNALTRAFRSSG
jgi:hypothetical protein